MSNPRRDQLEREHREKLAELDREESQARLLAMPKDTADALLAYERARTQERAAPLACEHMHDAIYEIVKSMLAQMPAAKKKSDTDTDKSTADDESDTSRGAHKSTSKDTK